MWEDWLGRDECPQEESSLRGCAAQAGSTFGGDVSIGDLETMWAFAEQRGWIRDRNNEEDAPVDLLSQFDSTTATPARRGAREPAVTHPFCEEAERGVQSPSHG